MNKRLHMKRSTTNISFRHYLFHFKWPLFGLFIIFLIISISQMNIISLNIPIKDATLNQSFHDVIYPIEIFHSEHVNRSIEYYFYRKDQMKKIEDEKSIERKQKILIPYQRRKAQMNSYLILEFTHVFFQPRFCSHKKEQIFGRTCPYTNW